jgi:APA family basic amino acid/polyamine antiporter
VPSSFPGGGYRRLAARKGLDGVNGQPEAASAGTPLTRAIGVWQATALNITMIVGAGVFATIPLMLTELPGPYALLGWIGAGALVLVDGLIWSELGAALPGSGGSYQYLLVAYGPKKWGRLMAFLFIWQFLISGPLELGSGFAAIAQFSTDLSPGFKEYNEGSKAEWTFHEWYEKGEKQSVGMSFRPARWLAFSFGVVIIALLYRNISSLGKMTVALWLGVLGTIAWVLIEGIWHFRAATAFSYSGDAGRWPDAFMGKLGAAMILAMYSYLGYYNVCYIGDEVRDPGRTIPRSIVFSALAVVILFVGLHLAMIGTIPWESVPKTKEELDVYNLPAEFMRVLHANWAASAITVLLIWCCLGSAFAGLLGYSRIPYGAARDGHFFSVFARVHPGARIPHFSLLLVGALMLFWAFFDLQTIINALITTRILEQFVGQIVGVMLLRKNRPDLYRPYKMMLYPLPCLLALVGWLYLYWSAGWVFVVLGIGTMSVGVLVFFIWARHTGGWPFHSTTESPLVATGG